MSEFTITEIQRVADYLATDEGKSLFRATKTREQAGGSGLGLPADTANAFALRDVFSHVLGSEDLPEDGWSGLVDYFEWVRICRTTDPTKIGAYLTEVMIDAGWFQAKPEIDETPAPETETADETGYEFRPGAEITVSETEGPRARRMTTAETFLSRDGDTAYYHRETVTEFPGDRPDHRTERIIAKELLPAPNGASLIEMTRTVASGPEAVAAWEGTGEETPEQEISSAGIEQIRRDLDTAIDNLSKLPEGSLAQPWERGRINGLRCALLLLGVPEPGEWFGAESA